MGTTKGFRGSPEERFWSRVNKKEEDECWVWTGGKSRPGYGLIHVDGKCVRAHRFSYELNTGPIPEGMLIRHTCDNPPCVNPSHLIPGTDLDNNRDMTSRGRNPTSGKLNDDQREEIRKRYFDKDGSCMTLSKEYNVSSSTIHRVVRAVMANTITE